VPTPLDDQPDRAIVRRAHAARGEVVDRAHEPETFTDDPSAEDVARFSEVTIRCHACGQELHDDVETCWKCGASVGLARHDGRRVPWWIILATVLALIAILVLAVR
jgi:hypothetical protein